MSAILKFIRENHILAIIEQAIEKKKSTLCLNAFEITDLPDLLYTCSDVEHMYLHKNKIGVVTVQLTQLVNLSTLTLDYNNITYLPPEIGNLKGLVNLNISYNPLKVLTPEIGNLENLEAFWCNRIQITEIPKEIGKLSKLDTFGARGNEIKSVPKEITQLTKLRWLTLENNHIEELPDKMDSMEFLVHFNLKNNRLKEIPSSIKKCADLMYLQLNDNEIEALPEDFETSAMLSLVVIDLRGNPICEGLHPEHPLIRFSEEMPQPTEAPAEESSPQASGSRVLAAQALAINATALLLPALPARAPDHLPLDMEMDNSSIDSSEDWENSVNSSELDVQYQSDDDRPQNEAVGMVLPELSRFASTAS